MPVNGSPEGGRVATDEPDIAALIAACREGKATSRIAAMLDLAKADAMQAAPVIIELLDSDDASVRETAVHVLERLGGAHVDSIGPRIEQFLFDPDPLMRSTAADTLAALRYGPARASLERTLRGDQDATVRASAAEALGDLGDPGARATLALALTDEHGPVRAYVALAVGLIGDGGQLSMVRRRLEVESWPPARAELLVAALRLGDEVAFDELLAFADGVDDEFTTQLYNALDDLLTRRTPPIVVARAAEFDQRLAALGASELRERLTELAAGESAGDR